MQDYALGAKTCHAACWESKRPGWRMVWLEISKKSSWRSDPEDRQRGTGQLGFLSSFLENQRHILCSHLFSFNKACFI